MRWGRGTTLFAAACVLRLGFFLGQEVGPNPYPLAESRAASHAAELRQIVERGVQTEQDQAIAKAACAAVLIECWMDREW